MKHSRRAARLALVVLSSLGVMIGCDVHSPTGPGTLATITVTPDPTLRIGGTQQFTAFGRDAAGAEVTISPTWSVVAGGGGIDARGMFTAGTVPGVFSATIKAVSGSHSGTATVTVTVGNLASIVVSPNPITLPMTGEQQYTAVGMDAGGNVLAILPVWSVVAGGGAISPSGKFTAGMVSGTFINTISAASDGISGAATVTVAPGNPANGPLATITVSPNPSSLVANGVAQFTATGRDAGGNVLAIAPVWSVVAGGGTINGNGLFAAGTTPGTYPNTIRAMSGSISGFATVSVAAGSLATIVVSPNPAGLGIRGTQLFTAVGKDANGNVVPVSPVWSVVAGGGTISGAGLFTAGTVPGNFPNTVSAASGNVSGAATVQVSAGVLATIVVTPNPVALSIDGVQQFSAVGKDASGNIVAIAPTWTVVNGGGAINAAGLFTAGTTPGNYPGTIRASSGTISGLATVTVSAGVLAAIVISPDPAQLGIGGTQQFTAVGKDASGNVVTITPVWSVVAGGGSIDAAGRFTASTVTGTFTNTIRAASGSIAGLATVQVSPGILSTIVVTPNPAALTINGTRQFTAVGKDAGGNIVAIAPVWSAVAGGGSIDAGGLFTAGTIPGSYPNTVRALVGGVSGFATVDVAAGPLATISVTPNPSTLPVNGTQLFTAVGRDAAGNILALTPSWSVVAGGGSIDGTGQFTAGTTVGTFPNTVRATSGTVFGAATATVTAGALATITVSPNPTTLSINGTRQFTAAGTDASGNAVPITSVWSVVASGGAITGAGLFTAGTVPGSYPNTVRVTSDGISGFATVDVTAGALATITVSPDPASLIIGGAQAFSAVGRDAGGNIVVFTPIWTVVAGGGAIDGTGLFTAGTVPGHFSNTVRARSGCIEGLATVDVSAGPIATMTISPNPVTLAVGASQQFTVVATDAAGNVVPSTPVWSTVAGGGVIDGGGLFSACITPGSFPNTVRAMSGGVSGFATVDVTAGPLATITVSPNPASVVASASQQFTATGTDASGNPVTISPSYVLVAGGGGITTSGLFTAGTAPGNYPNTVRAFVGTISGFASVDVTAAVPATITVSPDPASLNFAGTQQFTAAAADALGNPVTVSPVWTVVAGGGSISATGLFTAGNTAGSFLNTVRATSGSVSGFATVNITDAPTIVDLGNAETAGIVGNTAVTCTGAAHIGGDVDVAPGVSITGFPPCTASGNFHVNDPEANDAHSHIAAAFGQLGSMSCDIPVTLDLGGQILFPGVYCSPAGMALTGEVILDAQGDPNAIFVLQATSTLITAAGSRVTLINGARARNVYWRIGSSATLGANSFMEGNLVAFTSIGFGASVALTGRALAVNAAVTIGDAVTVTLP